MKNIIKGWSEYLKDTDIPEERLDMVRNCPNRKKAKIKMLQLEDRYPETRGYICADCYCPLPTKLRIEDCKCNGFKAD